MEALKPIDEFSKPDIRNIGLVRITPDGQIPVTYKDFYENIAKYNLSPSVPEEIKSYFEMIKNVYVHGWYYYPLFTLSYFLSLVAMEMALRERFKKEDPKRKNTFSKLMNMAVKKGLIKASKFSHVKRSWEKSKKMERDTIGFIKAFPETEEYCRVLAQNIPKSRNAFAHPWMTTIVPSHQASFNIKISSEFINQLFEVK
jgi:HD superfamily phosphohydrolase